MRHRLSVSIVGLLAFFIAGSAKARIVDFEGTLSLEVGGSPGRGCSLAQTGVGVATINTSAGGNHLTRIALAGGITGSEIFIVTDPLVTAQSLMSLRMWETLGSGTLGGLSTPSVPLTQRTLPVDGNLAFCLSVNCVEALNVRFHDTTANGAEIGVGIGGILTLGGYVGIRISLEYAPWTIKTRTLWSWIDETSMGQQLTTTTMLAGFRHGPTSNTTSTVNKSGVVSFITPTVLRTEGIAGNRQHVALFSRLTIHFVPEPGMVLLLGSGVAGLVALGRARMRRQA